MPTALPASQLPAAGVALRAPLASEAADASAGASDARPTRYRVTLPTASTAAAEAAGEGVVWMGRAEPTLLIDLGGGALGALRVPPAAAAGEVVLCAPAAEGGTRTEASGSAASPSTLEAEVPAGAVAGDVIVAETPSGGLVGGARVLDRQHVLKPPLNALASWLGTRGAPDAFDTLMLELATRLETSRSRAGSRTPGSYM